VEPIKVEFTGVEYSDSHEMLAVGVRELMGIFWQKGAEFQLA
jgi:hypothetical protein